jgi:hypothetical protein
MSITPGTPDDLIEFWKPYDVPPTHSPTDEPQEPQTPTSDLTAAFSPWSRGFTYGDWSHVRDAVWEGDPADEAEKPQRKYATDHHWTPGSTTNPFNKGDSCHVMLARYVCLYGKDEHPPGPPERVDVFGYRWRSDDDE